MMRKYISVINLKKANSDRCYGLVADDKYMLVCEYGCNGSDPEIIVYKKRLENSNWITS